MKYIHYGHFLFDKDEFIPVTNKPRSTKPRGGFWASRADTESGWKEYCEKNKYESWGIDRSFEFSLKEDSKILTITSSKQLETLPQLNKNELRRVWTELDFEELAKQYDAIEVLISEDFKLYFELHGWDCDSILIMNPDVIVVDNEWAEGFKKTREENKISIDEYKSMLQVASDKGKIDIKYVLRIFAETGIRIGDLENVTVEAIKQGEIPCNSITEYKATINKELQEELIKYCDEKNIKDGIIFFNINGEVLNKEYIRRQVKYIAKDANINKKTIFLHAFRWLYVKMARINKKEEVL